MNEISEKLSLNKFSEIVIDCIKFRHLFEIHNVKGKYSKIPLSIIDENETVEGKEVKNTKRERDAGFIESFLKRSQGTNMRVDFR